MDVESAAALGAMARLRREQLGWSQSRLAQKTSSTRQWISRFENGASDVTLERALAVLSALDLSVEILRPGEALTVSDPFERVRKQSRSIEVPHLDIAATLQSTDFRRAIEKMNRIALTVPQLDALRAPERSEDG
jgi:transcriptional regulator with XRE-family HTH domain